MEVDRREVLLAAGRGAGMILAGQGAASWSSPYLAPGVVAVLTSTMPLWAALIGWLAFGTRIARLGSFGLIAGFAGVVFLARQGAGAGISVEPALFVVARARGWAATVGGSRSGILRRPVPITSLQMLVGGELQIAVGLATGEAIQVVPHQLVPAIPVFVYPVAVPSLISFPLFTWLLSELPVHVANTAAYAAPVVALALGWLLLAEQIAPRMLGGVAVILVGVVLIVWSAGRTRPAAGAEPEPPVELEDAPQVVA
jgi:drug/metabolite transporter (DMT)-like permease